MPGAQVIYDVHDDYQATFEMRLRTFEFWAGCFPKYGGYLRVRLPEYLMQ